MNSNQVNPFSRPRNIPASKGVAVTPDNATDLPDVAYGLIATVGGTITVDFLDGGTNLTLSIAAGEILEVVVSRVYLTGTTATGIVALLGN